MFGSTFEYLDLYIWFCVMFRVCCSFDFGVINLTSNIQITDIGHDIDQNTWCKTQNYNRLIDSVTGKCSVNIMDTALTVTLFCATFCYLIAFNKYWIHATHDSFCVHWVIIKQNLIRNSDSIVSRLWSNSTWMQSRIGYGCRAINDGDHSCYVQMLVGRTTRPVNGFGVNSIWFCLVLFGFKWWKGTINLR